MGMDLRIASWDLKKKWTGQKPLQDPPKTTWDFTSKRKMQATVYENSADIGLINDLIDF